jgi:hypothetical protein
MGLIVFADVAVTISAFELSELSQPIVPRFVTGWTGFEVEPNIY